MPDSDLGDEIVQANLPQHFPSLGTPRTDFKAWHRVRKQFIRERQWNHEISHLVKRMRRELRNQGAQQGGSPDGNTTNQQEPLPEDIRISRPLRLLLLPGDELLDVRCMWNALQNEDCYLKFLGFNSGLTSDEQQQRMVVTVNAVTQLDKVCKDSYVTRDIFQNIANNSTQAYSLFKRYGPYDVVNLDLCGTLVPRGRPNETKANFEALHGLLNYQITNQKNQWLLFTTTQVDRHTVSQDEINKLAKPMRDNCDQHSEFANELGSIVPTAAFQSTEHQLDISHLDASQLVHIFGVILGKWLVDILASASPRWAVRLLTSYRYTIRQDMGIEMLSLGFLITPHFVTPIDSTGLSNLIPTTTPFPAEVDTAMKIISVAKQIQDVDKLLTDNPESRNALAQSKAELLAAVGYDKTSYLNWVEAGEHDAAED